MKAIKSYVFAVTLLSAVSAMAGGGGAGPTIEYASFVNCKAIDAAAPIQELIYFVRSESQWGSTQKKSGIYLEGQKLELTIYSLKGVLHTVQNSNTLPESINALSGSLFGVDHNVDSLEIVASGHNILLSIVTENEGPLVVKDLEMVCK